MAVKKEVSTEIVIPELRYGVLKLRIIGVTPMFQHRMSAKAKQQLLVGGGRKTKAERVDIKHHPVVEYRDCMERVRAGPTAIGFKVNSLKAAMCIGALVTPGIAKTDAQRLLFLPQEIVPLYGVPKLRMDVVRSADINKTPDIRTRPFFEKWGAEIEIRHLLPHLPTSSVITLACNAGNVSGVGDFRQEKGKGSFGCFRVITADMQDDEWDDLVANHGKDAQLAAIDDPEYADEDTTELMEFFHGEVKRRAA